jgi:hypothetical protein
LEKKAEQVLPRSKRHWVDRERVESGERGRMA